MKGKRGKGIGWDFAKTWHYCSAIIYPTAQAERPVPQGELPCPGPVIAIDPFAQALG